MQDLLRAIDKTYYEHCNVRAHTELEDNETFVVRLGSHRHILLFSSRTVPQKDHYATTRHFYISLKGDRQISPQQERRLRQYIRIVQAYDVLLCRKLYKNTFETKLNFEISTLAALFSGPEKEYTALQVRRSWTAYVRNARVHNLRFYLHTPYCASTCRFCMFRSTLLKDAQALDRYINNIKNYMKFFAPTFKKLSFRSIYYGGGTPSIYTFDQLEDILYTMRSLYSFHKKCLFTFEIHALSMTREKLQLLHKYGCNRISFGVQTFDKKRLQEVERPYISPLKVKEMVLMVHECGIPLVNVDLLVGLKNDTVNALVKSIRSLLEVRPSSITLNYVQHQKNSDYYSMTKEQLLTRRSAMIKKLLDILPELLASHGFKYVVLANAIILYDLRSAEVKEWIADIHRNAAHLSIFGVGLLSQSSIWSKSEFVNTSTGPDGEFIFRPDHPGFCGKNISIIVEILNYLEDTMHEAQMIDRALFKNVFGFDIADYFQGPIAELKKNGKVVMNKKTLTLTAPTIQERCRDLFFMLDKDKIARSGAMLRPV